MNEELEELREVQRIVESDVFQNYFAKPMKEERDKLRTAFFSDSLKESWRKGGKQEGIKFWMELVEQAHTDLKNLESSEGGQ